MSESIRKQTKEEERKAARKAEKAARKAANVAKIEESKAAKAEKDIQKKKDTKPKAKKVEDDAPVVRKVKDIWEALDLEKKGITVNENGEYTLKPKGKSGPVEGSNRSKRRGRHRLNRKGHAHKNRVCVITRKGEHVRVNRAIAETLVANGGKYIPKHQYQGKVNGEDVDWSGKK